MKVLKFEDKEKFSDHSNLKLQINIMYGWLRSS